MKEKIRVECPTCGGMGEIGDYGDEIGMPLECTVCNGSGQIWDYPEDPEFEPEDA